MLALEGVTATGQRYNLAHDWSQVASVDAACELDERGAGGLHDKERAPRIASPSVRKLVGVLDDRHQHPTWLENRPGALKHLTANQIEDKVHPADNILEPLMVDVDEAARAEFGDELAGPRPA